ncbi:MAG: YbjQ family protein [Candidatus Altarchaeum sp.]|nr:YbjQ family protein [Candidatus Altarchaeum sp.]
MIVVNTDYIQSKEITETLGLVKGSTVKAKWFGKDILAGLRNLVGGEVTEYTELLTEAREEASQRMIKEAEKLNADAVINVRFSTSAISNMASEILAYGTAVKIKNKF